MTRASRLLAGLAVAALVLGACGGDDDEGTSASDDTETSDTESLPTTTQSQVTVATTTTAAPPTPTTVVYVTEGASVMVTNASRVDGGAGRMSDRLADVGFTMVEPGNYTLGQLEVTKIYHDPANTAALAVAESLKSALGGGAIEVVEMGTPPPVESGDLLGATVLVAMGNDTADKTLDELQGITTTTTSTVADSTTTTSA